jgi:hypothetical protein
MIVLQDAKKSGQALEVQFEAQNKQAGEGGKPDVEPMELGDEIVPYINGNKTNVAESDISTTFGKCPINGCHMVIGTMTRENMFSHFKTHSDAKTQIGGPGLTTIECPLLDYKGENCLQKLSLKNGGADLRFHFTHRGTPEDQAAVQAAGADEDLLGPTITDMRETEISTELSQEAQEARKILKAREARDRLVAKYLPPKSTLKNKHKSNLETLKMASKPYVDIQIVETILGQAQAQKYASKSNAVAAVEEMKSKKTKNLLTKLSLKNLKKPLISYGTKPQRELSDDEYEPTKAPVDTNKRKQKDLDKEDEIDESKSWPWNGKALPSPSKRQKKTGEAKETEVGSSSGSFSPPDTPETDDENWPLY